MDLAVLIVGAIMGFIACYFTLGPGKEKMKNQKVNASRIVKRPRRSATGRRRGPAPQENED